MSGMQIWGAVGVADDDRSPVERSNMKSNLTAHKASGRARDGSIHQ